MFAAMRAMQRGNEPIDYLTVCDQLVRQGQLETVRGEGPWTSSPAGCPPPATAPNHARIVRQHAERSFREALLFPHRHPEPGDLGCTVAPYAVEEPDRVRERLDRWPSGWLTLAATELVAE